jgi:hypothetical protein
VDWAASAGADRRGCFKRAEFHSMRAFSVW